MTWREDPHDEIVAMFARLSVPVALGRGFRMTGEGRGPEAEAQRQRERRAREGATPLAPVQSRNAQIVAAVESGRTCLDVSREFGVSHAAVRQVVSRARRKAAA